MDIEFHYYITYVLARRAGFGADEADTIATSCQFVDDNSIQYHLNAGESDEYANYISQTANITKPRNTLQRIYSCFHFVPGRFDTVTAERTDGHMHRLNTTPDGEIAQQLMDEAAAGENLYRIGIAAHAYADTWAHQNFVGCADEFNAMAGFMPWVLPNIGHADAMHRPDVPNLIWEDERLVHANRTVSNKVRFLDAAEQLFARFCRMTDRRTRPEHVQERWTILRSELNDAIGPDSARQRRKCPHRIERYGQLAPDVAPYDGDAWFELAVRVSRRMEHRRDRGWIRKRGFLKRPGFAQSHWLRFQEAVKSHQKTALGLLARAYEHTRAGMRDEERF